MPLLDDDFRKAQIFNAYAAKVEAANTPAELKAAVAALADLKDDGLATLAGLKQSYAIAASGVREAKDANELAVKLAAAEAVAEAIKNDPIVKDAVSPLDAQVKG